MVEASEIGLEEEELELDLGLSIGGCFRKLDKSNSVEREIGNPFVSRSNSVEVDLRLIDNERTLLRSSTSPSEIDAVNGIVDLQTKREIHALRRQEAKKKQQKKRCRGRNSVIENAFEEQRSSKREKVGGNVNLNMSNGQTENYPVQYTYPPVPFVPFTNKFVYPCLIPCWNPSGNEKNGVEPVVYGGFRPFLPDQSLGLNGKRDVQIRKTTSNGSPMCSSSSASKHRSSSQEGGGSSDTGTNSSFSLNDQQKSIIENGTNGQLEQSACSHATEFAQGNVEEITDYNDKFMPKLNHLNSIDSEEETTLQLGSEPLPFNKSRSSTIEDSNPSPLKEAKVDCGKPPKPRPQNQNTPTLPQMPYVSTTGNGPNGKTITGLLYRYTKFEVSIVCVCHGSTFSPAQFVEHAGGTDIVNPLKHITVIPSAPF